MMKTKPYQIPRTRLAWMASEEYLRGFWWMAITTPIAGLFFVIYGNGLLQIVGLMGFAWPFSIPARAVLSTSKASSLFTHGCIAEIDDEYVIFVDTSGRQPPLRWKLPLIRIRDVIQRGDCLLIRMRKLGFAPILLSAFDSEEQRMTFVGAIDRAIAARFAEIEAYNP